MNWRSIRTCAVAMALATGAHADPRLATYPTDTGEIRFVALFDTVAMELEGCAGGAAARAVLGLSADVVEVQATLGGLTADFGLGSHPMLPCAQTALADQSWDSAAPVWADLLEGQSYFVAAPGNAGSVYEIPDHCTPIKEALNLRARVQQDGVLQGLFAPQDSTVLAVLDCGDAESGDVTPDPGPVSSGSAGLSLHTLPVFLSASSIGDTVYVIKGESSDGAPIVLPVWRIDGVEAPDLVLPDENSRSREQALKALIGLAADAPVTALGAADVVAVTQSLFADLCTGNCAGYVHRHGYFAFPGADLDLTFDGVSSDGAGIDLLGQAWQGVAFGDAGRLELAGCAGLATALGLSAPRDRPWNELAEEALGAAGTSQRITCAAAAGEGTCLRALADGAALQAEHLGPGSDCATASHLILELPGVVDAPAPLIVDTGAFRKITVRPAKEVERARLRITPFVAEDVSTCILSRPSRLVDVRGGGTVHLAQLDIQAAEGPVPTGTIGIDHHLGTLVLDRVTVQGGADSQLSTGILSCDGQFYGTGMQITAGQTSMLSIGSDLLLSAAEAATRRTTLTGGFVGLSLTSGAQARLDRTTVTASNGLSVRASSLVGTRVALEGPAVALPTGDALRLAHNADVSLMTSTLRAFRCVGLFVAETARAVLILPGNAPEEDNTRLSCGAGRVTII